MSDSTVPRSALTRREGGILSLSGPALTDLLRAVVGRGASFRFTARGFSMMPFIQNGDVITVSDSTVNPVRLGTVVAFVAGNGKLIVHRIVGRTGDERLVKGDNLTEDDGWVPNGRILGCVTRVERRGCAVRFGLGPERLFIAFLSRRGWLMPFLAPVRKFIWPQIRRWIR
jgi:signal peptidase I